MKTRLRAAVNALTTPADTSPPESPPESPRVTRPRGRPPGRDPNRKKAMITIRCTSEERDALRRYATDHNLDVSTWVRDTMLAIARADQ